MGDSVCIMRDGKVVQTGTPEELSMQPANDYVRDFIQTADKTKVMSVQNIMITPSCIVRLGDSLVTDEAEAMLADLAIAIDGAADIVGA